ncbi:hypothetical protein E1162_10700 [Rhodobacteraceae bacterium RKSG542]|uniref:hypothetical protein n=1 Tax=Pseudovibrio flavus TaxID=2529854 RepID=UPI0012BCBC93|nr:hypothetical protein [Pseudovibrio flavus]MTI17709.1 hypothetical protein [Pseudovibrio flavus]
MTKNRTIKLLASGLVLLFSASVASAGPIYLEVANPRICKIEVTVGANAPNGPARAYADLERDERVKFDADKICFRKTVGDDECSAGMTEWICCESAPGEEKVCLVP